MEGDQNPIGFSPLGLLMFINEAPFDRSDEHSGSCVCLFFVRAAPEFFGWKNRHRQFRRRRERDNSQVVP